MGWYFFIGFIIVIAIFYVVIENRDYEQKLKNLSEKRPNKSKEEYVEYFLKKGYKEEHIEAIHSEISGFVAFSGFTIHPDDDLISDYELDHQAIEEILMFASKTVRSSKLEEGTILKLNEKYSKKLTAEYFLELLGAKNGA